MGFRTVLLLGFAAATACAQAQSLPGTRPLVPQADFSAAMVAGIDKMALRLIEGSKKQRKPDRDTLKSILGIVDKRMPVGALELVGSTSAPALLAETAGARIYRVRWPVFPGVHGEGLYVVPKSKPLARVLFLPDADSYPETWASDARLANSGCEIVIPALISRGSEFSTNTAFGIQTNVPHREWIYRQAYELGRHILGYEIQKALAVVDWFDSQVDSLPIVVAGQGEGGLLAFYSAAVDPRISSAYVVGYFGPRENLWQEPLYRNVFGLLRAFGDAEVASLISPRPLVVHHHGFPLVDGPPPAHGGQRSITAPGRLTAPTWQAAQAEAAKALALAPGTWLKLCAEQDGWQNIVGHLLPEEMASAVRERISQGTSKAAPLSLPVDASRQERLVRELEAFSQRLIVSTEVERETQFWKRLPLQPSGLSDYAIESAKQRERFWTEVIGRLPDPDLPVNPRSRLVRETEKVVLHEVTLDVWQDVFSWGWLALPKNLKPGERRPVVVCQHGLEGLPEDVFNDDRETKAYAAYKAFALRLAEEGYITFAPHNPYRGRDAFRTLQRKLNPLGLTLFSVINGQHQRILEWLKMQPFVQADKIAFYGLSYGGKSAMRSPAVLTDYCLSICSGDFNEWVRKCVSKDLPMSYIHTPEYEIWEWNMGRTFNYSEMAALIAPRPFMVERGHNDGVGSDEWVNYEYAKVRRLYDKLGLGERSTIEHFDGPHTIHGRGSFEFLHKYLGIPSPSP